MTTAAASSLLDLFMTSFCAACSKVLSEKAANQWVVTGADKPAPTPAKAVSVELALEGKPANAAILLSAENAALLAGRITGQGDLSSTQMHQEHLDAVCGLFRGACLALATEPALKAFKFQVRMTETIAWKPGRQISLVASASPAGKIEFQILLSAELLDMLQLLANTVDKGDGAVQSGNNLALLENVDLDVTLRFGSRQLTLAEIGNIASGSVIELDKEVQEPVELLLGDKVIARGEVVIVEGNYGLRITEMV